MYLTRETNIEIFEQIAKLAPGSTFATTFMLNLDLLEGEDRQSLEYTMVKAKESGTPFISLFSPDEIQALAKEAGFKNTHCVLSSDIEELYFTGRSDGLSPASAEGLLIATT